MGPTSLSPSPPNLSFFLPYPRNPFKMSSQQERTYIMIKPDGVQRGLVGKIIQRFEQKGFFLVAMKLVKCDKAFAEKHYSDLSPKPFFNGLTNFLSRDPLSPWFGRARVLSRPAVCSLARPTPLIPLREPSVVTSASILAATSSTVPTPSSPPRRKSLCGSRRRSLSTTSSPMSSPATSTSKRTRCRRFRGHLVR